MSKHMEAADLIVRAVAVTREDISRAKSFILDTKECQTKNIADLWVSEQDATEPVGRDAVDLDSVSVGDEFAPRVAKSYSLRMALYQAAWELINAGELLPGGQCSLWTPKSIYAHSDGTSKGLELDRIAPCPYPARVYRPPLANDRPTDVDLFLKELDPGLHAGVREAVSQSLECFRRGLYLPALAMLGAGVEAAWIECGKAVAISLTDSSLQAIVDDQFRSLSKKVAETSKVLEGGKGKAILKAARIGKPRLADAVQWTTVLRAHRNALHWGKAKSFVADHSDAASILLGAPIHLRTLEAIRNAC